MSDSPRDFELELLQELNVKFNALSDVQRVEIRRRYDKAMAIGISSHKATESIEKYEKDALIISKHIWIAIGFCAVLLMAFHQMRSYFDLSDGWMVVTLSILIHPAINLISLLSMVRINAVVKSELKTLEHQWMCVSPNFELREFINLRKKNNLTVSEKGSFSMSALQLKSSIVNLISFKYSF
jgi:hypothetical protein